MKHTDAEADMATRRPTETLLKRNPLTVIF